MISLVKAYVFSFLCLIPILSIEFIEAQNTESIKIRNKKEIYQQANVINIPQQSQTQPENLKNTPYRFIDESNKVFIQKRHHSLPYVSTYHESYNTRPYSTSSTYYYKNGGYYNHRWNKRNWHGLYKNGHHDERHNKDRGHHHNSNHDHHHRSGHHRQHK